MMNFLGKSPQRKDKATTMKGKKTINQLISEDIERCKQFLSNPTDENAGCALYVEITGKYDSIIEGFGNGLYQYYPKQHFYDPEISCESLIHNLKVLLNKMISYQAANYLSIQNTPLQREEKHMSNKIFIVHGHDNEAIQEMA